MEEKTKYNHEEVSKKLFSIIFDKLGISEERITSGRRQRVLVDPRRIMMSILKEECPKITVVKIGEIVGCLHSNVSIQLGKHTELVNTDKDYNALYHKIRQELKKLPPTSKSVTNFYEQRDYYLGQLKSLDDKISDLEVKTQSFGKND